MKQVVLDLFNTKYETTLTFNDVIFENPRQSPPGSPKNTVVDVRSYPDSEIAYFEVVFGYGRLDVSRIAEAHPTLNVPPNLGTLHDAIFELRTQWNLPQLNPEDVFDMVLPTTPGTITILAKVDSFGLQGSALFQLTREFITEGNEEN